MNSTWACRSNAAITIKQPRNKFAIALTYPRRHFFSLSLRYFFDVMLSLIICINRYQWIYAATHLGAVFYVIHLLICYQRRKDWLSVVLLVWIGLAWVGGFSVPFLLGHAFLGTINFEWETWWYVGGIIIGHYIPAILICATVYWLGDDLDLLMAKRCKYLRSRDPQRALPGEDQYSTATPLLSTTASKEQV